MSDIASVRRVWKEYFSLKHSRYYYCNNTTGESSWFLPKQLQDAECLLDVDMFGVTLPQSSSLFQVLLALCNEQWHTPALLWNSISTMHKMVSNIVSCGNTVDKFRRIKTSNAKFAETVGSLPGGLGLLTAAGFRVAGDKVEFPEGGDLKLPSVHAGFRVAGDKVEFPEGGDLKLLAVLNSRLCQLHERKGFTGQAETVDDTKETSSVKGTPGFRYQREIFECSVCGRAINDGTDRLVTRNDDAPKGEFRYHCEACSSFDLCEVCWERFQEQQVPLHDPRHPFTAIHPHQTLHGLHAVQSGSNPWGNPRYGPISARARQRLKDRTGL